MDRETRRLVEEFRRNDASPIENNLIDELVAGELDRPEFLRRAAVFGLGAGTIGLLLRYMGEEPAFGGTLAPAKVGGTLRVGSVAYNSSLEPYGLREAGSLGLAGIPGEYLTYTNNKLQVRPWLATSWKPNKALTVWTFQIRQGRQVPQRQDAERRTTSSPASGSTCRSEGLAGPRRAPGVDDRPEGVVKTGPVHRAVPAEVSRTTPSRTSSARRRTRRSSSRRRSLRSREPGCRAA